ncbi:MAG: hypothetical protein ACREPI_06885 [Candidatus Dormibacterales bacterium]
MIRTAGRPRAAAAAGFGRGRDHPADAQLGPAGQAALERLDREVLVARATAAGGLLELVDQVGRQHDSEATLRQATGGVPSPPEER